MQVNMNKVLSTKVEATVIDGEILYGSIGSSGGASSFGISFLAQETTRLWERILSYFFV
jgi:hypothetical protein